MTHPPKPPRGALADYWGKQVSDLVSIPDPGLPRVDQEKHRIFCAVVMALVESNWNGNRRGKDGTYGKHRKGQELAAGHPNGRYEGGDYLGHNIAAIAVGKDDRIIDFDFNHNDVFHRSTEHAEARLVHRVFSLSQLYSEWTTKKERRDRPHLDLLPDVTIYSSLESCSQCSGIMALGTLKQVVYIQRDPGQFSIGNILWRLNETARYPAPLPIPADLIGLDEFTRLGNGFEAFCTEMGDDKAEPFFKSTDGTFTDRSKAITSYLCTDDAREIFRVGAARLAKPPEHPENAGVLQHARGFVEYALRDGRRGSGH